MSITYLKSERPKIARNQFNYVETASLMSAGMSVNSFSDNGEMSYPIIGIYKYPIGGNAGTDGIVPAPDGNTPNYFLKANGYWTDLPAYDCIMRDNNNYKIDKPIIFDNSDNTKVIFKDGIQVDGESIFNAVAQFKSLDAEMITTDDLTALEANITYLEATNADIDNLNSQSITTKDLEVTGSAHFFELIIDKVQAAGGNVILSPSNFRIDYIDGSGKLYQYNDDGNKQTDNLCEVGDLMICKSFNIKAGAHNNVSNKYYWVKVIGTGTDTVNERNAFYITIDRTTYDGTLNTEVGDELVCLGNTSNVSRQNAIILSSTNSFDTWNNIGAPSIAQYKGINTFSLAARVVNVISPNQNMFKGQFKVEVGGNEVDLADDINSRIQRTYYAYANDINGTGFNTTFSGQDFIGIYTGTDIIQPNDASKYTWKKIRGNDAASAAQWTIGSDGHWYKDGIKQDDIAVPLPPSEWTIGSDGYWYKDGNKTSNVAVPETPDSWYINEDGYWCNNSGQTQYKAIGAQGTSITAIKEWYKCTVNNTTTPSNTDGGWSENIPSTYSTTTPYLWNYEEVVFSTGVSQKSQVALIGKYGKDGKYITDIQEWYKLIASKDSLPSTMPTTTNPATVGGWSTTAPYPTKENPYLVNFERIIFNDNTVHHTAPVIISTYVENGKDGNRNTLLPLKEDVRVVVENGHINLKVDVEYDTSLVEETIHRIDLVFPAVYEGETTANYMLTNKGNNIFGTVRTFNDWNLKPRYYIGIMLRCTVNGNDVLMDSRTLQVNVTPDTVFEVTKDSITGAVFGHETFTTVQQNANSITQQVSDAKDEIRSEIDTRANAINLSITNISQDLEKVGIHLDGDNSTVSIIGSLDVRQNSDNDIDRIRIFDANNNVRVEMSPETMGSKNAMLNSIKNKAHIDLEKKINTVAPVGYVYLSLNALKTDSRKKLMKVGININEFDETIDKVWICKNANITDYNHIYTTEPTVTKTEIYTADKTGWQFTAPSSRRLYSLLERTTDASEYQFNETDDFDLCIKYTVTNNNNEYVLSSLFTDWEWEADDANHAYIRSDGMFFAPNKDMNLYVGDDEISIETKGNEQDYVGYVPNNGDNRQIFESVSSEEGIILQGKGRRNGALIQHKVMNNGSIKNIPLGGSTVKLLELTYNTNQGYYVLNGNYDTYILKPSSTVYNYKVILPYETSQGGGAFLYDGRKITIIIASNVAYNASGKVTISTNENIPIYLYRSIHTVGNYTTKTDYDTRNRNQKSISLPRYFYVPKTVSDSFYSDMDGGSNSMFDKQYHFSVSLVYMNGDWYEI